MVCSASDPHSCQYAKSSHLSQNHMIPAKHTILVKAEFDFSEQILEYRLKQNLMAWIKKLIKQMS